MWENINGEWIYIDKEMGAEEHARLTMEQRNVRVAGNHCYDAGRGLSAGGLAIGVASGIVGARVVSRIGGWLFWIILLLFLVMILM